MDIQPSQSQSCTCTALHFAVDGLGRHAGVEVVTMDFKDIIAQEIAAKKRELELAKQAKGEAAYLKRSELERQKLEEAERERQRMAELKEVFLKL